MKTRFVYLNHLDIPFKGKQHYLGSAQVVERRQAEHRAGKGSLFMAEIVRQGIGWQVARVWDAGEGKGRVLEGQLRAQKNHRRFCPICQAQRRDEFIAQGLTGLFEAFAVKD